MRNDYTFEWAGVSYKQVLPSGDWPYMEKFLRTFLTYADRAQELQIKPDVGLFLSEYAGGRRWRRKLIGEAKQKIVELAGKGYRPYRIAKILGFDGATVWRYLKKEAKTCQK